MNTNSINSFEDLECWKACRESRGSLYELMDQFITASDEKYISKDEYQKGRELLDRSKGILNGYIKYLQQAKKRKDNEAKS